MKLPVTKTASIAYFQPNKTKQLKTKSWPKRNSELSKNQKGNKLTNPPAIASITVNKTGLYLLFNPNNGMSFSLSLLKVKEKSYFAKL
ncbi:hypothetical protein PCIT_b0474 [Pseudoalteromonas citrea]|uniref:Uncharacterized protein n=1 Tax=Pseudoalteromonas citrea TaxID=43655 RepID=A0AAD4AEP5_9GAMM|nr:hypothetical protein PCIT_b0474 [Pseudoalteromonas citrea]